MPALSRIQVYPVKSLDPVTVGSAALDPGGSLALDRRWATFDATAGDPPDAPYVNGKNERRVHRLRSEFDPDERTLRLREPDASEWHAFDPDVDRDALEAWLTDFFGYDVAVRRDDELGYPDDTDASGPTLVSTGTLDAVAGWFDGIDAAEMRRRLRPNLVVDAPAFWEDRLYADRESAVPFTVGGVRFEGVNPCQRCVVPTRDPETGEETPGFQRRFVERREDTLPEWVDRDWYDHYFRLMVNTRVTDTGGASLSVGDTVETAAEPSPDAG